MSLALFNRPSLWVSLRRGFLTAIQKLKLILGVEILGSVLRSLHQQRQGSSGRLYQVSPRSASASIDADRLNASVQFRPFRSALPLQPAEPLWYHRDAISQKYCHQLRTAGGDRTDEAGVITAHQVEVSLPIGMHRWQGRVFEQALLSDYLLTNPKYVWDLERMPLRRKRDQCGEAVLLTMPWHHNFFHWMVEILPRLQLYDEVPELQSVPLIVPQSAPRFVRDSLALAGYGDRVQFLEDGVYRFETLHLLTRLSLTVDVSPLAIAWLHQKFSQATSKVSFSNPPSKRIYISRRDAKIRRVTNEAALESVLSRFGLTPIVPSDYSLAEQIALFQQAELVVGSHGAAFTHLAFMKPRGTLIEFFSPDHFNHAYNRMAQLRQLNYGFLVGRQEALGFAIDPQALTQLLEQAVDVPRGKYHGNSPENQILL
jgi:Glycosyltransferase 61